MSIGFSLTNTLQSEVQCLWVVWYIGNATTQCVGSWFYDLLVIKVVFTRNPCLTDYATQLLMEKVKSSIMSKCHCVIRNLENYKMVEMDKKGISPKNWWFWIATIQIPEGKQSTAIEDADLIQPFIKLRIKSIRLMAFNQSSLSAFISIQPRNS